MTKRAQDTGRDIPWPRLPDGCPVVLHTRVTGQTCDDLDKTLLLSASILAGSGYGAVAAYVHADGDPTMDDVRRQAEKTGCPLIGVPSRGVLGGLLGVCRRYNVQVWHSHDYKSSLLGLALRPFWPMKLVATVHDWSTRSTLTSLSCAVYRWSLPYYHHVVCASPELVDRVMALGVLPDRCTQTCHVVDEKTFVRRCPPAQSPLRIGGRDVLTGAGTGTAVPPGRLVVGAIGPLSPDKALNSLIRAAHVLIKKGMDLELWIAGEGECSDELRVLVEHLGLRDRVKLLGFWPDLIGFYHTLDLFVSSSLTESTPCRVLEAMAMRVPVVSTQVPVVSGLITDGLTGLLCPIGSIDLLAGAMARVLADDNLRQDLADAGRRRIEQAYSCRKQVANMKSIYDRVLGSSAQSGRRGGSVHGDVARERRPA